MAKGIVVVLDDEIGAEPPTGEFADLRRDLEEGIEGAGFEARFVSNARDGLKVIRELKDSVKLLLLDMVLGENEEEFGNKVLRELWKDKAGFPTIVVSTQKPYLRHRPDTSPLKSGGSDRNAMKKIGMTDWIKKEEFVKIKPPQLSNMISGLVNDPENEDKKLVLDAQTGTISIVDKKSGKELSKSGINFATGDVAAVFADNCELKYMEDSVVRLIYDICRSACVPKKALAKRKGEDFADKVYDFNAAIQKDSDYCIAGKLLVSCGGGGTRSGMYKLQIGDAVELNASGKCIAASRGNASVPGLSGTRKELLALAEQVESLKRIAGLEPEFRKDIAESRSDIRKLQSNVVWLTKELDRQNKKLKELKRK